MKTTLSQEGAATPSKKDRFDKKNVNVRVNPFINFQIGVVAALLLALVIIEVSTAQVETINPIRTIAHNEPIDWVHKEFTEVPNEEVKKEVVKKPETPKVNKELPPVEVPDTDPDPEPEPDVDPVDPVDPVDGEPNDQPVTDAKSKTTAAAPAVKAPITTTLDGVDSMPLFPGCESLDNNEDRKKCFNEKMQRFVQRKFNKDLADDINLNDGDMVKIDILFTINEKGLPVDVKVRAPHEILKKEAYRLVGKLPRIEPGKIKGEPVSVYFHLPIRFQVRN
ncbi:MAG: energy transducer TonB [Nonlabens sp.]|uniref:energy transducer TonB n=1 Tax=Nonlabens sp. TaxID=1888209 RepID=UPI003EF96CD9